MKRRQYVETAAGLAALGSGGIAGCTDVIRDGDESEASDEYDEISKWVVAPAVVDRNHYTTTSFGIDGYHAVADRGDADPYERLDFLNDIVPGLEIGSYALDNAEYLHVMGGYLVVEGDGVDAGEIERSFDDAGIDRVGSHGGYELFESEDGSDGFGVGDGSVIGAFESEDPTEIVRRVVDAERGEGRLYEDSHDGFDRLTDEIAPGFFTEVRTTEPGEETDLESGEFEGSVAQGSVVRYDGEEVTGIGVIVFEESVTVGESEVEEHLESVPGRREYDETDVSIGDGVLRVERTTSAADYF